MILKEKNAILFGSISAIFLASIKLFYGIVFGSMAVLSSAIDSLLDFCVSMVNYFSFKKAQEPHDDTHNFGHGKIEGLCALFEGLLISISGISIIFLSIKKYINQDRSFQVEHSIFVMMLAIAVTFFVVYILQKAVKISGSLIIQSDLLHYKTDFLTNSGIIVSLIVIKITGFLIIDLIISSLISLYIIYSSFMIIKNGVDMLMDKSLDQKDILDIENIIKKFYGKITSYHNLKTRKSGNKIFVEVHLVFDQTITLFESHNISDQIVDEIKKGYDNIDVITHLDPYIDD